MNSEQEQLEQDLVRFTAQLHDLERERTDTLNALNTAQRRLDTIKAEQVRAEREGQERAHLEQLIAQLRVRIAENPYSKPTAHAEHVLNLLELGRTYPDTAAALRAVSAAISGFRADRRAADYQARQSAVANELALLPTKPRQ